MKTTRLVINCVTREIQEIDLTPAEILELTQLEQEEAAREAAEDVYTNDIQTRRASILADLQAIRDATGFAAARGPLLRILVFLLRRFREQAT